MQEVVAAVVTQLIKEEVDPLKIRNIRKQ